MRWDNQVGLDMNFGTPRLDVHEPRVSASKSPRLRRVLARRRVFLKGTHWLVAAAEAWRLRLADGLEVRRTSSAKRQSIAVARLRGEKIRGIVIDLRTGATRFHFDLGATLEVRPPRQFRDEEFELWSLHAPGNRYVSVGAGGVYRTGSTKKPDAPLRPIKNPGMRLELIIGSAPSLRSAAVPAKKRSFR